MKRYCYSILLLFSFAAMALGNSLLSRAQGSSGHTAPVELVSRPISSEEANGMPKGTEDYEGPVPGTESYENFSGALFIGDSRTAGLSEYGDLGEAEIFANSGMSVFNVFEAGVKGKSGEKMSLEELLADNSYQNIYVMLGINELGYEFSSIVKKYQDTVEKIKRLQPSAAIVLEANLHVTQEQSAKSPIYNNENIDALNQEIKKIAESMDCTYIDINEVFDDSDGNLADEYSFDGSHVLGKYYAVWTEWLKESLISL